MRNRKPVFFEAPSEGEPQPARGAAGSADAPRGSFSRIFGALKGTVMIAPGTDLTDPIGEEWDAERCTIEKRLQGNLPDETSDDPVALRASEDPVLAELWDKPADAAYDDL